MHHQVTYCYDEEGLKKLIMPENLTAEFGGTLHYDHSYWIYVKTVSNKSICIHCSHTLNVQQLKIWFITLYVCYRIMKRFLYNGRRLKMNCQEWGLDWPVLSWYIQWRRQRNKCLSTWSLRKSFATRFVIPQKQQKIS